MPISKCQGGSATVIQDTIQPWLVGQSWSPGPHAAGSVVFQGAYELCGLA